eukprot:TRINITY_DN4315_c0_g1_i1.p1 TRINITY_DN4315_c0_g1~~TRINITY_DN4315_c0_g1_i1.p1  ORF type:complete len:216 (-),score=32.04 TRINITY_DN4315_c0_g1_i1:220-867(-)
MKKGVSYTKVHPELYEYNEKFLDPVLLNGNVKEIVHEEVEQIYKFKLFTPEYCKMMIEEAEAVNAWHTEWAPFTDVPLNGLEEDDEPETTLHLKKMPPMEDVFYQIVDKHIKPLTEYLWKTYKMKKKDRPYILKYEPEVIKSMGLHWDNETLALVVTLSDPSDYEGGGTYFPRWNYSTGKPPAGTAIIYPGGLSHEHMGLETTAGKRYLFLCAFY